MNKHKTPSLRLRTNVLMSIIAVMLGSMLFISTWYAIGIVRSNTLDDVSHICALYVEQLDDAIDSADNYMAGLQSSVNLYEMQTAENDVDFYRYAALLKKDMDAALQTYRYVDCLFVYQADRDLFYESRHYRNGDEAFRRIREAIRGEVRSLVQADDEIPSGWRGFEYRGRHYFLRVIHSKSSYSRNSYIGSCISAEDLLEDMKGNALGVADYLTFLKHDGEDFCGVLPEELAYIRGSREIVRVSERAGRADYLHVEEPLKKPPFSLAAFIRDKSVIGGLGTLRSLYPAAALMAALLILGFSFLQRRWILRPTARICEAMEEMRDGNLDVRVEVLDSGAEFRLIEETFNEMAGHIKALRIDIYEEQMQRQQTELSHEREKYAWQKSELQYLQLQINPHFYINCLNIINNLSLTGRNDLIQKMTEYLGNHLRYTLEGNVTGPLAREMEYVRNYVHIQELRFGDCLRMNMETEPGTELAEVPPLVLQTFVENTVKYEVVPGAETEIYIVVLWEGAAHERLLIEIWDSGGGYPEEVLQKLSSGDKLLRDGRERFGIRNLVSRMRILYGDEGTIEFANHFETGGAYVRISLPATARHGAAPDLIEERGI